MKYTNFTYSLGTLEPLTDIVIDDYNHNIDIYVKMSTTRLRVASIYKHNGEIK